MGQIRGFEVFFNKNMGHIWDIFRNLRPRRFIEIIVLEYSITHCSQFLSLINKTVVDLNCDIPVVSKFK